MGELMTAKECQLRIDQFVDVAKTDEALAQSYLQDHDWNVEASINKFLVDTAPDDVVISTKPPEKFAFATWNVDGMEATNLEARAKYIAGQIETLGLDVVFLQEVTAPVLHILERLLFTYHIVPQENGQTYFTCVLIRVTTVYVDGEASTEPFGNSSMGRAMQVIRAHIGPLKLALINSHLESTKDGAAERCSQFKACMNKVAAEEPERAVIFAGDLNLRDSEVKDVPGGVDDLWIALGQRKECQFTWDATRNNNIQIPGKFRPRLRFDRVYFRKGRSGLTPRQFNLIGIEKVPGTQRFPSDHWGILCTFEISQPLKEEA